MSEYAALKSVQDLIRWGVSRFHQAELYFGHGTDNAWDESRLLVLHALYLPWETPESYLQCRVTEEEREAAVGLLLERVRLRIPAAYLTGHARFAGLEFIVDDRVLVPRSPIAELIDSRFAPWLERDPERILDLCTGSGCIGIACAIAFDESEVVLADLSADALAVAEANIDMHGLTERVEARWSDGFDGLAGERFDLIVSNPPYVDAEDMDGLPDEYHHEPEMGLAAGDDGLDLVRRMLAEAANYLTEDGALVIEVGNSMVHVMAEWPEVDFEWVKFAHGGHGVFVLSAEQCRHFQPLFAGGR
ncbi:50S ribosomal protein L3 N(5)-glutamine methyltransferase [Pseudomonas sp. 5Ae-yellow]|uniref:50S ribosomal protein L3 N(5)-glutamine methyltransferase n=1 Tax=Pseudomonas sp. 5Ae-yellow TaxID=2759848 RepID=UPI0015F64A79|nr:50S ribosomal protein L3 N(5)-glutamine methyltransferase [Pseudomonas sp. 5Ae-yellow]MBA6419478.1 50S ribosomal protein L3 N(5)-glutamine methyltransferase [Pseudomonas sp. 5Ae-yellow]|tara:strand:- start:4275 stop:5186 length:912 start_codon:yes stop_codon:yes gene_type:complete